MKIIDLAQDRHLQRVGHFKLANDTIPATPLSVPPGTTAQSKSMHQDRVAAF